MAFLNKNQPKNNSGPHFTDDVYATPRMIRAEVGMSLIDGIWSDVLAYRKPFKKVVPYLKRMDGSAFHATFTEKIEGKLQEARAKIAAIDESYRQAAESGASAKQDADKKLSYACLRHLSNHLVPMVNEFSLLSILSGTFHDEDKRLSAYPSYLNLLRTLPGNFAGDYEDFLDSCSFALGMGENLYRADKRNRFSYAYYSSWTYGDGVNSDEIGGFLDNLYNLLLSEYDPLLKSLFAIFYLDFVRPFAANEDMLSAIIAKQALKAIAPNCYQYLPVEGILLQSADYTDRAKQAASEGDITYCLLFLLDRLSKNLEEMGITLSQIEAAPKLEEASPAVEAPKEEEAKTPPPSEEPGEAITEAEPAVEAEPPEAKKKEVEELKPKRVEAKVERIASIGTEEFGLSAMTPPKSTFSEKEIKQLARYIEETHPLLRKPQAAFYASHCSIGRYYTISDYKSCAKCAYETARTSMDRLAEEGLYKKLKLKNKYVYTPRRSGEEE